MGERVGGPGWGFDAFSCLLFGPARTMLTYFRARPLSTDNVLPHLRALPFVSLCQAVGDDGNAYMRSLANDLEESYPSSTMSFSSMDKDKGKDKGLNSSLGMGWLTDRCSGNRDSKQKEGLYQVGLLSFPRGLYILNICPHDNFRGHPSTTDRLHVQGAWMAFMLNGAACSSLLCSDVSRLTCT